MKTKILFDVDLSSLNNFNEALVVDYMTLFLNQDQSICRCQNCLEDIYSLSLRMIEPRYHPNSLIEKISTKYISAQKKFSADAENKVRRAITTVTTNPHHL